MYQPFDVTASSSLSLSHTHTHTHTHTHKKGSSFIRSGRPLTQRCQECWPQLLLLGEGFPVSDGSRGRKKGCRYRVLPQTCSVSVGSARVPITITDHRSIAYVLTIILIFGGLRKGGSSSNWILMSCQPQRVTSWQSNSGHKQIHISKLFSRIDMSTLCQVSLQKQSLRKHKTYINKHQNQIFEELIPSILPLLKEYIRLGHAGIADHSV